MWRASAGLLLLLLLPLLRPLLKLLMMLPGCSMKKNAICVGSLCDSNNAQKGGCLRDPARRISGSSRRQGWWVRGCTTWIEEGENLLQCTVAVKVKQNQNHDRNECAFTISPDFFKFSRFCLFVLHYDGYHWKILGMWGSSTRGLGMYTGASGRLLSA